MYCGHMLVISAGCAAALVLTIFLPSSANAFWPFSNDASAATEGIIPSHTTPVLEATTNSDSNAQPASSPSISDNALYAHQGPNGSPGDSVVTPTSDRISTYAVRPGDTLSEIADLFGVSVNTVIWANNLKSAKDVHPGDTLIILPVSGVKRTIVKGDTLKSLAKRYGADAEEIAAYNGLDAGAPLALGATVIIPGGEVIAPSPAAKPRSGTTKIINGSPQGGAGVATGGYFSNPLPGRILTQGIHGGSGVDIGGNGVSGTPIRAAAGGTIIISRSGGGWNGGYGNYVVITHGNGTQTLYAHMSNSIVSPGQSVSAGQVIGYVGSSGQSTGAHLHFEVRGAPTPFRNCRVNSVCNI